jgi:hypothetical protein
MKKLFTLLTAIAFTIPAFAQIDDDNSSVQVVGYWNKNEKHTYSLQHQKKNVEGFDTIVVYDVKYKADIKIIDSSATGYIVEWKYYDFVVSSTDEVSGKLAKLNEGLIVKVSTDEIGTFKELLNWTDIKEHNQKALKILEKQKGFDNIQQKVSFTLKDRYSSKEAIEAHSIKDIRQFYDFHGITLALGETLSDGAIQENTITKEPIHSKYFLELAEIDIENRSYTIRFKQIFDTAAFKTLAKDMVTEFVDKSTSDFLKSMAVEEYLAVNMHESGWPLELYYNREIYVNEKMQIETRSVVFEE